MAGSRFGGRDTRAPLREKALAQLPPGKQLEKGDVDGLKQAVLDAINSHPDLFTSLPDMVRYLEVRHGISYTAMRIGQVFRELGIGLIDGRYAVLPMEFTQGDAWDQLSDDIKVYAAEDPRLRGDKVYLHVRGGTTTLFDIDIEGIRLDPANLDEVLAVTTGWSDVLVHFADIESARRFWVKCMKAHRPGWDDPDVIDPKSTKDALYMALKRRGVLGEDEACKEFGLEPSDFRLLMDMLRKEYPISKQGKAYSLHTRALFWEEQGLRGSARKVSESESEGDDAEADS